MWIKKTEYDELQNNLSGMLKEADKLRREIEFLKSRNVELVNELTNSQRQCGNHCYACANANFDSCGEKLACMLDVPCPDFVNIKEKR